MSRRRNDALSQSKSQEYIYRDDGCEISRSCLSCPLPQCKYDDPRWYMEERRKERDRRVLETKEREKLSVSEVARRFELSPRTVFRILRRGSAGELMAGVGAGQGAGMDAG